MSTVSISRNEAPGASARARGRRIGDADALQDHTERADVAEPELEQVETDESGGREEPLRDEDRAAFDAEGERDEDDAAGEDPDRAFDGHGCTPSEDGKRASLSTGASWRRRKTA